MAECMPFAASEQWFCCRTVSDCGSPSQLGFMKNCCSSVFPSSEQVEISENTESSAAWHTPDTNVSRAPLPNKLYKTREATQLLSSSPSIRTTAHRAAVSASTGPLGVGAGGSGAGAGT